MVAMEIGGGLYSCLRHTMFQPWAFWSTMKECSTGVRSYVSSTVEWAALEAHAGLTLCVRICSSLQYVLATQRQQRRVFQEVCTTTI